MGSCPKTGPTTPFHLLVYRLGKYNHAHTRREQRIHFSVFPKAPFRLSVAIFGCPRKRYPELASRSLNLKVQTVR